MGFHLLAYMESTPFGAVDDDIVAVADPEFSRRNNHYILSEGYKALAFFAAGTSMTRARLNIPSINAYGRHQIWPLVQLNLVPSLPPVQDLRLYPMDLPENEEIGVETSNSLGAASENHHILMWIGDPTWNMNIPRGEQRFTARATATGAGVALTWGAATALTMADNLKGGTYAVVGMQVQGTGVWGARLIFPNAQMNQGRKLRPGVMGQGAITNVPWDVQMGGLGVFGYFNSFELPQLEILTETTASPALEIRLDLIYMGRSFMARR